MLFTNISLVILAYLLGSVSFGYLLVKKLKNIDIRKVGSGSAGATNISRVLGLKLALLVFLLDIGKGFLAVLLAGKFASSPWIIIVCAFAVIIGHNWPIFFSFKGGRGSATTLGVIIAIMPLESLIIFAIIVLIILTTRYVSLASMVGSVLIPIFLFLFQHPPQYYLLGFSITALIIWRHIPNIKRLLQGTEPKFGDKINIS